MGSKREGESEYIGDDDHPWTEEQWEQMMRESDLRAARFGELLETLQDHPKRDVLVAREMGWTELADTLERHPHPEPEAAGHAEAAAGLDVEDESDDPFPADSDEEDLDLVGDETDLETQQILQDRKEGLHRIPAYMTCMKVGRTVMDALRPYQKREDLDEETSELLGHAFIGIHIACAKISGGHAMGYDDEVLCGNIVNNKRALEGARQSITAFQALESAGFLPSELVQTLLPPLREAEASIEARIVELRSKVWWT